MRRIALVLILPVFALPSVKVSTSQQSHLPTELRDVLTTQALAFLRNEFNILVTGTSPPEGLVSRHDGMTRLQISGEQRIAALLKSRESSLRYGKRYTSIEITLSPAGIEEHDGKVILHALDNRVEHFTFDPEPLRPIPHFYDESTHHDFIFSRVALSANMPSKTYTIQNGNFEYTLIEDITEPQLLKVSDEKSKQKKYSAPPASPLSDAPQADGLLKQKRHLQERSRLAANSALTISRYLLST